MRTLPLFVLLACCVQSVPAAEPKPFPGKVSRWNGFQRHDFNIAGTKAIVVVPDRPLPGRPWVWRGEFFGAFANADIELVKAGWHLAYLSVPDLFGAPKAMVRWEQFHSRLVGDYGLHPKPGLIGLSRGALYCLAWAAEHPDKTLAVYLDNGVCDYRSWPGGKLKGHGTGAGSAAEWNKLLKAYAFKNDQEAFTSKANPIEKLTPIAKASIPVLLVYGDKDRVVPHKENSEIVYERIRKLGGPIERIVKPGQDHHPHGLTNPKPILEFFTRALQGTTVMYVSVAGEKRIAVYREDPSTGKVTLLGSVTLEGEPGALTVDPQRRFLFAALRSTGKLVSFRIEAKTGLLHHINTVDAGPDPAQISTDQDGRFLLSAYYVDAKVTVHAIGKNGALSEKPVQSIPTTEKAHAIVPDSSNRFVFVPHTGPDVIYQFLFNSKTGLLSPNSQLKLTTPKKTGPRHLVFHPTKPIAYISNEQGSGITAYSLDTKTGLLKSLQTLSTLPADFKGTNACSEIRIHPSGRFVYVANRGHDSIACFALDKDGKMSASDIVTTEKTPRSFDIDPDGKYLFVAGESSGKLIRYKIDIKTGRLKSGETLLVGKKPWWVMITRLGS